VRFWVSAPVKEVWLAVAVYKNRVLTPKLLLRPMYGIT